MQFRPSGRELRHTGYQTGWRFQKPHHLSRNLPSTPTSPSLHQERHHDEACSCTLIAKNEKCGGFGHWIRYSVTASGQNKSRTWTHWSSRRKWSSESVTLMKKQKMMQLLWKSRWSNWVMSKFKDILVRYNRFVMQTPRPFGKFYLHMHII